jgi:hypothetical protein
LPGSSHGLALQRFLLSMDHGSCLTYSSLLHTHSRAPRCSCPDYLTSSMCDAIPLERVEEGPGMLLRGAGVSFLLCPLNLAIVSPTQPLSSNTKSQSRCRTSPSARAPQQENPTKKNEQSSSSLQRQMTTTTTKKPSSARALGPSATKSPTKHARRNRPRRSASSVGSLIRTWMAML